MRNPDRRKCRERHVICGSATDYECVFRDIIEFAGIQGDPNVYGTDAYHFLDKPHRFIADLMRDRDRLARELTQTLSAIQIVAEGGEPPIRPKSAAFDAVVELVKRVS
jgi:hypothetical protein